MRKQNELYTTKISLGEKELLKFFKEWFNQLDFNDPNLLTRNEMLKFLRGEFQGLGYWKKGRGKSKKKIETIKIIPEKW